jgi:hypothetical protein
VLHKTDTRRVVSVGGGPEWFAAWQSNMGYVAPDECAPRFCWVPPGAGLVALMLTSYYERFSAAQLYVEGGNLVYNTVIL